jgi:hypothetical protein
MTGLIVAVRDEMYRLIMAVRDQILGDEVAHHGGTH